VALTVIRTIRDDFGVEIWRDLGVRETPSIFARAESIVAICVTSCSALAIWIRHNLAALRVTLGLVCLSFAIVGGSAFLQSSGSISPFGFMVICGVGMYVPYVAFHTTVFERLIAASRHPCNLGFLMYLADSVGYLGYAAIILWGAARGEPDRILPLFQWTLGIAAVASIVSLVFAMIFLERAIAQERVSGESDRATPSLEDMAPGIAQG
jgi:hypothetical protein